MRLIDLSLAQTDIWYVCWMVAVTCRQMLEATAKLNASQCGTASGGCPMIHGPASLFCYQGGAQHRLHPFVIQLAQPAVHWLPKWARLPVCNFHRLVALLLAPACNCW